MDRVTIWELPNIQKLKAVPPSRASVLVWNLFLYIYIVEIC